MSRHQHRYLWPFLLCFFLVIGPWEMNPDQDAHQISIKIVVREPSREYFGIITWFPHIPLQDQRSLEKDRKTE